MKDGVYDLTNHPSNPVEDRLKWETVQGNWMVIVFSSAAIIMDRVA